MCADIFMWGCQQAKVKEGSGSQRVNKQINMSNLSKSLFRTKYVHFHRDRWEAHRIDLHSPLVEGCLQGNLSPTLPGDIFVQAKWFPTASEQAYGLSTKWYVAETGGGGDTIRMSLSLQEHQNKQTNKRKNLKLTITTVVSLEI